LEQEGEEEAQEIQMNKEDNQEMKEEKNNETLLPEEAADVIKKKTNRS